MYKFMMIIDAVVLIFDAVVFICDAVVFNTNKCFHLTIHEQVCIQEACNMITGCKSRRASHGFRFIDTNSTESRTRMLKGNKALEKLQDDSEDVVADGWVEHFQNRPADQFNMRYTYCQFSMWCERKPTFSKGRSVETPSQGRTSDSASEDEPDRGDPYRNNDGSDRPIPHDDSDCEEPRDGSCRMDIDSEPASSTPTPPRVDTTTAPKCTVRFATPIIIYV